MFPHKIFLREVGAKYEPPPKSNNNAVTALEGEQVRQFYEEIIQGPSQSVLKPSKVQSSAKIKPAPKRAAEKVKNIWLAAETNNVEALKQILENGEDVNSRDKFGWTSLMCAACSGAIESVKFLMKAGAHIQARDPGYDALYLAEKHGHHTIVKLLSEGLTPEPGPRSARKKYPPQYCDTCKISYSTSKKSHETSTSHLVAVGSVKTRTFYGIPESNRGFQMLMRHGWDRERGLGPEGSGRKFPIKAIKKTSRSGIGAPDKPKKARPDEKFDETYPMTIKDERRFERNFRMEFS